MYNIRLGYGCGIKATLLTSTGAVFDLRKARYKGAVLMLPNGASIPCADVSIDDVTNSVYVRLLADRELTMIGKYGIMFNLKLANGVMYSSPMVVFAEVSADAEVEYKELNISLGVALTYLPANVAYTGASPKIGPNGTWLVYNDELNAYEDTGEPANYGGLLGEVQSLKDIIETSLTPHFITNAVKVDWETIGKNADGELCYIGAGIGDNEGNIDIAILDGYLTDRGYAKHIDIAKEYATKEWVEEKKFITIDSLPQKISAFANDKGYITIDALAPYATLATTLGGYGIINAYTKTETDARIFGEVKRLFEDPRFVTAAVNIDNHTIKRDGNGALYVDETALSISGGGGGGVADSVHWNNVIGKPSWIGSTKPTYKYSEIEERPDLSVYAKLTDIPSLSGYATQSWVENKGYLLATTASNTYQPKITSSNKLAYSLISNTPDLSVYALNTALAKKWTQNDVKIANWDSAYNWGNHANAGYAKASDVTNEFKNYVKLAGDSQSITAQHNFANGLKIGGISLRKVDNYLYFDSSLVLSGGVTMYGDDGTTVKPIWESIPFDRTTIDWVNGKWTVVGGVGSGGISEEFLNVTLQGYQPKITSSNKLAYSLISGTPDLSVYALKTTIPTKLSQLTDDVVAGKYLPITGGTINGSLTATSFIGNLTGNVIANSLSVNSQTLLKYTADDYKFKDVLSFTWSSDANDGIKLSVPGWHPEDTFLHLTALKGAMFSHTVTAPTFIGNLTGTAENAKCLGEITATRYALDHTGEYKNNINADNLLRVGFYSNVTGNGVGNSNFPDGYGRLFSWGDSYTRVQMHATSWGQLAFRSGSYSLEGAAWKYISFIDSDSLSPASGTLTVNGNITATGNVTAPNFFGNADSAYRLLTNDGKNMVHLGANTLYIGDTIYTNNQTHILGKSIRLRYGGSASVGMTLTETGNIAIGSPTAEAKLHVHGTAKFEGDATFSKKVIIGTIPVEESADGTLYVDANVVFRGGVAMYGDTTTTINEE